AALDGGNNRKEDEELSLHVGREIEEQNNHHTEPDPAKPLTACATRLTPEVGQWLTAGFLSELASHSQNAQQK
ncbi:hypothetical protein BgiMline_024274, partial [Biomphalaria glabrata]